MTETKRNKPACQCWCGCKVKGDNGKAGLCSICQQGSHLEKAVRR